jgi:hypothetical protein
VSGTYKGVIIAESLADPAVLADVTIVKTRVEPVTERHQTPWITRWTMHVVEIPAARAEAVARRLAGAIDATRGAWYADFKNDSSHYVVFAARVFRVPRDEPAAYEEPKAHGRSLGIPEHQLDFDSYDPDQL